MQKNRTIGRRAIGFGVILLFALGAGGALLAGPAREPLKSAAQANVPRIVALRVHHDLCPYCKGLVAQPAYAELGSKPQDQEVLFLTIDLTSPKSQQQSAMLLAALGLSEHWPAAVSSVGTLTLVDWKSRRSLHSGRAVDVASIRSALQKAAEAQP